MTKGSFYIEELFQFEKKWYGVLKIKGNDTFMKFVEITNIYPGGCDWMTMRNETMEKAVAYFYQKDKKNKKNELK